MARFPSKITERSIEVAPSAVCHFLRIPLEIRDEIYKMLLTTPYCTTLGPNEILEFQPSMNTLRANKKISAEATRVFLEQNDFVILKVVGLTRLPLEDVPAFRFLAEAKITHPILRVKVESVHESRHRDVKITGIPITLITTPEGLQPIITTLWKLERTRPDHIDRSQGSIASVPCYPSDLNISLSFDVKASVRSTAMKKLVLKPWELLHGIVNLALAGNIGDSLRQRLRKSMLEGPFPAEVAVTLTGFHTMGQKAMLQKNYTVARCWWTLYEDYCRHLSHLMTDLSSEQELGNDDNNSWIELLFQSKRMYYQGRLGTTMTYLQQSRYEEAVMTAVEARCERSLLTYHPDTLSVFLEAKFFLCEALAYTALGEIEAGVHRLSLAASLFYWCAANSTSVATTSNTLQMWAETLRISINREFVKLNLPHRCNTMPNLKIEACMDYPAGMEERSFWEWLHLPEE
jgi:hypothetical protein